MPLICLGAGILAGFFAISCTKKGTYFIKAIYQAISVYLLSYVISSALLTAMDYYSVNKASLLGTCFVVLWLAFLLVKGNRPSWDFSIRKYIVPIVASIILIPIFTIAPFEYFAMGQDEGVYQTEAIMYMRGVTAVETYHPEYDISPTQEEKDAFYNASMSPNVLGVYDLSVLDSNRPISNGLYGTVHGLHTFSSVMALWASIWGISNMVGVNTLIYILCLFWIWEILGLLKIKLIPGIIAEAVFALSPIVIWVTKSALTEIGLTLIWLVFTYFLVGGRKSDKYLAGFISGIYGLWHVSAYVFLPLFVFLFVALYFYTSDKDYLKGGIISTVFFALSFMYEFKVARFYTLMNFIPRKLSFINDNNSLYIVLCVAVVIIAVLMVLLFMKPAKVKFNETVLSVIIKIIFAICVVWIIKTAIANNIESRDIPIITAIAYFIMTGFSIMVCVLVSMIGFTKRWVKSKEALILASIFIYCIPVYAAFLRFSVIYYYYYSRYIAMYIPIIAITFAYAMNELKGRQCIATLVAGLVSIAYMLPHCIYLANLKDDSRIEWSTIESLEETLTIYDAEAVFLSPSLYYIAYYDLYSMGIRAFPIYDNFDECAPDIAQYYDRIYIIDDGSHSDITYGRPLISKIMNTGRENNGRAEDILRMPHDCDEYIFPVIDVYKYEKPA